MQNHTKTKKAIDCPIIVALIFTPTPLASVNVRVGESLATLRLLRSLHTHTLINFGLSHNVSHLSDEWISESKEQRDTNTYHGNGIQ